MNPDGKPDAGFIFGDVDKDRQLPDSLATNVLNMSILPARPHLAYRIEIGGLGQMPRWWFSVKSTTNEHMLHQSKSAIEHALSSETKQRVMIRARLAKQRLPVEKWVEDLNTLQQTAIKIYNEEKDSYPRGIF
jgi:hypothetical protein